MISDATKARTVVRMSLAQYPLLAFSSLFVIVDPVATVPRFLAMAARDTPAQLIKTTELACRISVEVECFK